MRSLIMGFVLVYGLCCGQSYAQDCASGKCFRPVQATMQATERVVSGVVKMPVMLTRGAVQATKQVRTHVASRHQARKARRASCGCGR